MLLPVPRGCLAGRRRLFPESESAEDPGAVPDNRQRPMRLFDRWADRRAGRVPIDQPLRAESVHYPSCGP